MINGIKAYRLKASFTTDDAANLLNVSKSTVYKIEQGCLFPSLYLLDRMRKVYNCTSDELLDALRLEENKGT